MENVPRRARIYYVVEASRAAAEPYVPYDWQPTDEGWMTAAGDRVVLSYGASVPRGATYLSLRG